MMDDFGEIQEAIDDVGGTVLLRRLPPGAQPIRTDVEVTAFVRNFAPHELAGEIIQGDRFVAIGTREIRDRQWPAPPKRGDLVFITDPISGKVATTRVESAEVVTVRNMTVRYNLVVRGQQNE